MSPRSVAGPAPVVLVSGADPALVNDAVRQAVGDALAGEDRTLALEELGGEELVVAAIADAAMTPPFLTGRRVLLVRNVGQWSTEQLEPLLAYLREPLETTALVLVAGGGQTSRKLLDAVKKAGRLVDAGTPRSGRDRTSWVTARLRAAPLRFDAPSGALLADHLGEDLGRLTSILDVLVSAYGEGAAIGVEQVRPFLGAAGGVAPWDLTDAIDAGDTAGALDALRRLTDGGERHPLVVLSSLHRHYSSILRLDGDGARSDQEAAAVLGVSDFQARKAMRQAQRLGPANVARAIDLLAAADLDLRGLKAWPDGLVLEILVARLSRLGAPRPPATGRRPR
jgi:DNA polymerase III subunit delta